MSAFSPELLAAYCTDDVGARVRADAPDFGYSDGAEVERRLEQAVRACVDRSVLSMELRAHIVDWPTRYHLTPVRANLLRPLEALLKGADVLEIGAGCGAITRYMGEAGAGSVLALEGSRARGRIAALRCAGLDNVTVIADTLQGFDAPAQFDVVTLIGVLEYARIHFRVSSDGDAVDHMLRAARARLRPGGTLIVAIENQLGLKYFCGYDEDHVAEPFYGIEDLYRDDGVVTFGRRELRNRLAAAGLERQEWLFPFPDYKLPCAVVRSEALDRPEIGDLSPLLRGSVVADPQTPQHKLFSLEQAWGAAFRNGVAGDLANSFLVVASDRELTHVSEDIASVYSVERRPCFAKSTHVQVQGEGLVVTTRRLGAEGVGEGSDLVQNLEDSRFHAGALWQPALAARLSRKGWTLQDVCDWLAVWVDALPGTSRRERADPDRVLPRNYWDAIPKNLMVGRQGARFIDLEWQRSQPLRFPVLFYRATLLSLLAVGSVAPPADPALLSMRALLPSLFAHFGLDADDSTLASLHASEMAFQACVNGVGWIDFASVQAYSLPTVAART